MTQGLPLQVSMDQTQSPKTGSAAQAKSGKVGNPNPQRPADYDITHVSPPVDQNSQLTVGISRQFGKGSGQFRSDDPLRRDSSVVECQDFLGLRRLQAQGIPKNLLDLNEPPSGCLLFKKGFEFRQGFIPLSTAPAGAG